MKKIQIIAEIGINHNGDIEIAKKLIDIAAESGCDLVKFQKRNPDVCVPESKKNQLRNTPWGNITYLEYKKRIEFSKQQYEILFDYARLKNLIPFASVFDTDSVDIIHKLTNILKIGSANTKDAELCKYARSKSQTLMISTGISREEDIEKYNKEYNPDIIFHTTSVYPCPKELLNLRYIEWLKNKYKDKIIGYSGHESSIYPTIIAASLGVKYIERHITLDQNMWGSDHKSSLNPDQLKILCSEIRNMEIYLQQTVTARTIYPEELIKS